MKKLIVTVLIALGLIGGIAASFAPPADAGQHKCKSGDGC